MSQDKFIVTQNIKTVFKITESIKYVFKIAKNPYFPFIASPSLWIFWNGVWDDAGIWIDTELIP